jgi:NitT/TauT family transport system ATP-binding protein
VPASPLLTLTGVGKTYSNGVNALAGIDLKIQAGAFVSLLGPSGCGKSTLLRVIAGLTAASTGEVRWREPHAAGTGRIGFVFQDPTLMPWANVADNVFLPLRLRGESRGAATARIDEVLAQVGLSEFARAFPRELSGGMKMRVSLARALVTQPDILLLDEPFAALDEMTRFKLNDDLLALCRARKLTVLFVTHSVFESVFLAGRVVVMTPRPGTLFADLPISFPVARDAGLRTMPEFGATCARVSASLAEAIRSAA